MTEAFEKSGILEWLRRTEAVEVDHDETGPYATPGMAVPNYQYRVWATNGESDPRAWAGGILARCHSLHDAELVAEALRMAATPPDLERVAIAWFATRHPEVEWDETNEWWWERSRAAAKVILAALEADHDG